MSQPKSKTNGHDTAAKIEPLPSDTTLAIREQIEALQARLEAETEHDKVRGELAAFVEARPLLTRRDVLDLAKAMKPMRGKRAVKTRVPMGYKPYNGKITKIGRAIEAGMKAKNLSKVQLTKLLNTAGGTVANYQAGRAVPSELMAKRLAKALGRPEAEFRA